MKIKYKIKDKSAPEVGMMLEFIDTEENRMIMIDHYRFNNSGTCKLENYFKVKIDSVVLPTGSDNWREKKGRCIIARNLEGLRAYVPFDCYRVIGYSKE